MSRSLPSQRDVVIGYTPDDGSIDIFEEFEEADGCLLVIGEVADVWTAFYRLDGEKLAPILGQYDWFEQLIPTGSRDLGGLVQLLTATPESTVSRLTAAMISAATGVGIGLGGVFEVVSLVIGAAATGIDSPTRYKCSVWCGRRHGTGWGGSRGCESAATWGIWARERQN